MEFQGEPVSNKTDRPGGKPRLLRAVLRCAGAVPLVALSAALRLWPLGDLGLGVPYITFYPTIMVGALLGGITTGLVATLLSAVVILSWSPAAQPFIQSRADWLGLAVFVINCTMISIICEAMHRARTRAAAANEELRGHRERLEEMVAERTAALTAEMAERRKADERERHVNRVLRAIRNVNQLIVRRTRRGSSRERATCWWRHVAIARYGSRR